MPQLAQFKIEWRPREVPLAPVAAAAQGEASLWLARRLLQLDDKSLSHLEGVAGNQLIVVRGPAEFLPWTDGIQYLGLDSGAPLLLLPTNYQPVLPEALVARALSTKAKHAGVVAVLLRPLVLAPLRDARRISRGVLTAWLEQA